MVRKIYDTKIFKKYPINSFAVVEVVADSKEEARKRLDAAGLLVIEVNETDKPIISTMKTNGKIYPFTESIKSKWTY